MKLIRYRKLLAILLLPLLLTGLSLYFLSIRGPFWLGATSDPEYAYLLNSFNFLQRKPIGHTDHPGTPLQVLGGATIFVASQPSKDYDQVLLNPEFYLMRISIILIFINVLIVGLAGLVVLWSSRNLSLALGTQIVPFLSTALLYHSFTRVSPETLLFTATVAVSSLLTTYFVISKNSTDKQSWLKILLAALIGLAMGFGIAVKVTILPLVIIPLIVLNWRGKLIYLLTGFASTILFTLPVASQYERIFGWLLGIATHEEKYGTGKAGFGDWGTIITNIVNNHLREPVLLLGYAIILVILILLWRPRERWRQHILELQYLAAILIAAGGMHVLIGRHNEIHYLVPLFSLSGLIICIGIYTFSSLASPEINRWINQILVTGIAVIATASVISANMTYARLQNITTSTYQVQAKLAANYSEYCQAYYYRSSSEDYSLKFGDDFALHLQAADLERTRGMNDVYSYNVWDGLFYDWSGPMTAIELMKTCGNKLLIIGKDFSLQAAEYQPKFQIQEILELANSPANESVYLVTPE